MTTTKIVFNATTGKKLSLSITNERALDMSADDLWDAISTSKGEPVLVDEAKRLYVNPAAIAYWYELK